MKTIAAAVFLPFLISVPDICAQTIPGSFDQLQVLVRPGNSIHVTDFAGNVAAGKVTGLSDSSLKLLTNGITRDFSEAEVFEIKQWRADSVKNGAIIGAGVGVGLAILAMVAICPSSSCSTGDTILGTALYTGIGAAVGVGIDALIPTKQTVFQNRTRRSSFQFHWQPVLSRTHKGVSISLSF